MKNKELEEAARRLLYNKHPYHPPQDSGYWEDMFKEGAKWQAERMYSDIDEAIWLLKQTTEFEVLESFKGKVKELEKYKNR